ncbi:MAG: hypothetical protein ABIE68_03650 [bacterium]
MGRPVQNLVEMQKLVTMALLRWIGEFFNHTLEEIKPFELVDQARNLEHYPGLTLEQATKAMRPRIHDVFITNPGWVELSHMSHKNKDGLERLDIWVVESGFFAYSLRPSCYKVTNELIFFLEHYLEMPKSWISAKLYEQICRNEKKISVLFVPTEAITNPNTRNTFMYFIPSDKHPDLDIEWSRYDHIRSVSGPFGLLKSQGDYHGHSRRIPRFGPKVRDGFPIRREAITEESIQQA